MTHPRTTPRFLLIFPFVGVRRYRKQIATLLGYPSWAHYVTETRMSGSPEKVTDFMAGIQRMAGAGFKADMESLRAAKQADLIQRGKCTDADADAVTVEAYSWLGLDSLFLATALTLDPGPTFTPSRPAARTPSLPHTHRFCPFLPLLTWSMHVPRVTAVHRCTLF